ncbi:MAG: hypothetical protein ACP5IZ_09675 [Thermoprotei archaeon]
MNRRGLSTAVAYILLIFVVFLSDAMLIAIYTGTLSEYLAPAQEIPLKIAQAPITGSYIITPYAQTYTQTEERGRIREVVTITEQMLDISLVNNNPTPTETVLLGVFSTNLYYNVLDVIGSVGIIWPNQQPPEGVTLITNPKWFPQAYYALKIMPHKSATFKIPMVFGEPKKLYACTPIGCTILPKLQAQTFSETTTTATWIITGEKTVEPPHPITQTWEWTESTVWIHPSTGVFKETVIQQSAERGSILSYSFLKYGAEAVYPSIIVAGSYIGSPSPGLPCSSNYVDIFGCNYPYPFTRKSVIINGKIYNIHGMTIESDPKLIPNDWESEMRWYDSETRTITLIVTVRVGNGGTFKDIFGNANYFHVYMAVAGYEHFEWNSRDEKDIVQIMIFYKEKGKQDLTPVKDGTIVGDPDSLNLSAPNKFVWSDRVLASSIPLSGVDEIRVKIIYVMKRVLYYSTLSKPSVVVRLPFYVEFIPDSL